MIYETDFTNLIFSAISRFYECRFLLHRCSSSVNQPKFIGQSYLSFSFVKKLKILVTEKYIRGFKLLVTFQSASIAFSAERKPAVKKVRGPSVANILREWVRIRCLTLINFASPGQYSFINSKFRFT